MSTAEIAAADAVRRALDYVCLAQLYLQDNLVLREPLRAKHVVEAPSGHWGVCPPVNAVLAALGTLPNPVRERIVVYGAGHAGPAARAHTWLTGSLHIQDPAYSRDITGLRHLVKGFRSGDRFGSEITPLLPDQHYMGGQLGPALAVAQGMILDEPDRLGVALIGDGELETGAAAAAWLGAHALRETGRHGLVLPVVLLNGLRMGGRSLLAELGTDGTAAWLAGLGYEPITTRNSSTTAIRAALQQGLTRTRPAEHGPGPVVLVTVPKGHGAPAELAGNPKLHKTPLPNPHHQPDELAQLAQWLQHYRPGQLFTDDGQPHAQVRAGLGPPRASTIPRPEPAHGCAAAAKDQAAEARATGRDFGTAMTATLHALRRAWALRVFSPDELASNRIRINEPWCLEVLNEELCHLWAQGLTETGRRTVVVSYEAFSPIVASLLSQQLTARRLAAAAGRPAMPSITYLLTSLGWNNTISHGNPALSDTLLATEDPAVHVYTPADPARAAAALTLAGGTLGRMSLVVASKHPVTEHPLDTLPAELADGYAIWPHLSDDTPELVLLSAGDVAATELTTAADLLRATRPGLRLRYAHVHDLTCLGDPATWPLGIPEHTFDEVFPPTIPILMVTTGHATALRALLHARAQPRHTVIRGWKPVSGPLAPDQLRRHAGIDADSLRAAALDLLDIPQEA